MTGISRLAIGTTLLGTALLYPDLLWAASETAHATAEHGQEGGGGGMPQLEAPVVTQLFWLAVTFGGLLLVLKRGALPQIAETLERREERLSGDIARAAELRQEAEEMQRENERLMEEARDSAQKSIAETRAACEKQAAEAAAVAESEIVAKIDDAESAINARRGEALAALPETAGQVAATIAERLGLNTNADAIVQAVNRRRGA